MTILLSALAVAIAGAAWVIYPLVFKRWVIFTDAIPGSVVETETRRKVALSALKEVEYDRAAGKLDDADYALLRGQLEVEALTALRASMPAEAGAVVTSGLGKHVCGFENPVGSRFCAGCGTRLG